MNALTRLLDRQRATELVDFVLVFALLVWLHLSAPAEHPPVPLRTSLMESIYVTALALDAELEETGSLPPNLEAVGMDDPTLTYVPGSDGYVLVAKSGEVRIEYRQGEDLRPYREAFEQLLPPFPEGP